MNYAKIKKICQALLCLFPALMGSCALRRDGGTASITVGVRPGTSVDVVQSAELSRPATARPGDEASAGAGVGDNSGGKAK